MATATMTERDTSAKAGNLVDMSWDSITRIVGSLGIYTKIDFAARRVAECYSTSSIFRVRSEVDKAAIAGRLS